MTRRTYVLDAWALLAWIGDETPASGRVGALLDEAALGRKRLLACVVNLGEVYYRLAKTAGLATAQRVRAELAAAPIETVSASDDLVWAAAELKAGYSISYADAFAAAVALRARAPILTGDPEFSPLRRAGLRIRRLCRASR